MRISTTLSFLLLSLAALGGCATKDYGRMEPVASDAAPTTCAAVDAQLADTQKFRTEVAHKSEFSGADVWAFLIDFGIGNAMEKSAALKSADEREQQLKAKQAQLGCAGGVQHAEAN